MKESTLGQNRTGKTNIDNDNEILQTLGMLYMHAIMSTRLHFIQDLIKVCSEETYKGLYRSRLTVGCGYTHQKLHYIAL